MALQLKKESKDPNVVNDEWLELLRYKGVGKKIMSMRESDYKRMKYLDIRPTTQAFHFIRKKREELNPKLKKNEPHYLYNFIAILRRIHKYIDISRHNTLKWFPLKIHPPLLLYLVPHWIGTNCDKLEMVVLDHQIYTLFAKISKRIQQIWTNMGLPSGCG